MSGPSLSTTTGAVVSGITTEAVLEPGYGPPGLRVTWISWHSPFRSGGLALGDRIVAVDGVSLAEALQPGKFMSEIGQANESLGWQRRHATAEQAVALTVVREDGEHHVAGALSAEQRHVDPRGRAALAPGGPARLEKDGFNSTWASWDEQIVRALSIVRADAWRWQSMDTRRTRAALLTEAPRIDHLVTHYPGRYAEMMRSDWQAALDCLLGSKIDAVDLEYREFGARRLEQVAAEATRTWELLRARPDAVDAFPAPAIADRSALAGKTVFLPPLTERDWAVDLGRSFAVARDGSGAYFVRLTGSPSFLRCYAARDRFATNVSPGLGPRWDFAGTVANDPIMISVNGSVVRGFVVETTAVRCGAAGECVVDAAVIERAGVSPFAGEALLRPISTAAPPDTASPADVITAMVDAVKVADRQRWRALFATWDAGRFDGRNYYNPLYVRGEGAYDSAWSESRARLTDDVYDVRIAGIEPIRAVLTAQPEIGLPHVEGVVVWVDPVGRFDDAFRTFDATFRHRRWPLQRRDGGPWRIVTVQSL